MDVIDEDWEEYDPSKGKFWHHMLAGSAAGVMEHTAMFPLDTYKVGETADAARWQPPACVAPQPSPVFMSNACVVAQTYCQTTRERASASSFLRMVKENGLARMWRGVTAMFVACIPSHAAYFSIYEISKEMLGANLPGHHPVQAATAGVLATTLHDAVLTPMDVVKQRLQLGYYSGVVDCVRTIVREEGAVALFRSYPTTVLMNVPYASLVVSSNESVKKLLNPSGELNMPVYLFAGAVSGAVASFFTNPLDVVKTRLQTQSLRTTIAPAAPSSTALPTDRFKANFSSFRLQQVANLYTGLPRRPEYHSAWDAAGKIYASEGFSGFFKGARARMLVHTPSMAISWSTYELVKSALVRNT